MLTLLSRSPSGRAQPARVVMALPSLIRLHLQVERRAGVMF
jgi:hypothetical protein